MGHVVNDNLLWPDDEPYPDGEGWVYRIVAFRESKGTQSVHEEYLTEEAAKTEMDRLLARNPNSAVSDRQWGYQLQRRPPAEWEIVEHTVPVGHVACIPKCHIEKATGRTCLDGTCALLEIMDTSS